MHPRTGTGMPNGGTTQHTETLLGEPDVAHQAARETGSVRKGCERLVKQKVPTFGLRLRKLSVTSTGIGATTVH